MRAASNWRQALTAVLVSAALSSSVLVALQLARPTSVRYSNVPPPPNGYFTLKPPGSYAALPGDARAAAMVHQSAWEPRRGNTRYNQETPLRLRIRPEAVASHAYDPRWNKYILARITGHFTGTTDEIFQWAAAKWGLPDNLLRTIAYMESNWHQSNYGDYVDDRAECQRGYSSVPCPITFGLVGTKSTSWPGIFPWNRDATAAAVDVLAGFLRGCYNGWVWWLRQHGNRSRGIYHAGDIWGCVGAWYSGNWHDGPVRGPGGQSYILRAQNWDRSRPWLHSKF